MVTRNRIIAAIVAVLIIVISFVAFLSSTQDRIVEQNKRYLEGTTLQTSRRVGDLLTNAGTMVKVVANTYEMRMTSNMVNAEELPELLRGTPFDHLIYADGSGAVYDDRGDRKSVV